MRHPLGGVHVTEWALEMDHITKDFFGVKALDDISIRVKQGEIHGLCGENGAGKSTLMNVLSGVYPFGTFTGTIRINGENVKFHSVKDSEWAGVSIIHQELNLITEFSVYENIFLGNEISRQGIISIETMVNESQKLLDLLKINANPIMKVKNLGIGEQQLIAIAKGLKNKSKLLILDEPTAALTDREVEVLLNLIVELKKQGVSIIYISHKLKEVMRIADTVTVLRDGKSIGTEPISRLTESKIVSMMVGRDLSNLFPRQTVTPGSVIFELKDWTVRDYYTGRLVVDGASFLVREGEILGIAGLVGAGRTELVTSLFGAYHGSSRGVIKIAGQEVIIRRPEDAINKGIGLVTEDRKSLGLVLNMDILRNTSLVQIASGLSFRVMNETAEVSEVQSIVAKLGVKFRSLESPVRTLSGGNQQKVAIAKWLMVHPRILIMDEPTRGIDVGAKHEIYELMNELTRQGVAIIMVSSELPEVLGMSDRILIMSYGKLRGELTRKEATEVKVLELAMGGR